MPEQVLVFDFGTSYFKAALVDSAGTVGAVCRHATPVRTDGVKREIDPGVFLETVRTMTQTLRDQSANQLRDVRAITFSTQANTFVLLDGADRPLTPLIVWNDARAAGDDLTWSDDDRSITGIDAVNPYFSIAKLRAITRTEPALVTKARRLRFLGDVFTHWLTGEHRTDGSIAWLSAMFDVRAWRWCEMLAERYGVRASWLPEVMRCGAPVGRLLPRSAEQLGVPDDCVLVMGLLDQFAGAVGVGNCSVGDLSETTGTVLATVRCTDTFVPQPAGVLIGPAYREGHYYQMAVSDVSANLLESLRQRTGLSFEQIDALTIHPSPLHLDVGEPIDALRAKVLAWSGRESIGAVVGAVYDAVARALAMQVRTLASEAPPRLLRSAGGAARSRRWLQIKANALRVPVLAPATDEPTLLGAASIARATMGWRSANPVPDPGDRLILPE